jgi:predicted XRE-type DNA-binding protein
MSKVTESSGNVFADLGFPDAETHLLKAELVCRIEQQIKTAKLTQAQAAKLMSMTQPDVSKMLRGHYRPISLERLMQCLVALGQSVTIEVGQPADSAKPAIRVKEAKLIPA